MSSFTVFRVASSPPSSTSDEVEGWSVSEVEIEYAGGLTEFELIVQVAEAAHTSSPEHGFVAVMEAWTEYVAEHYIFECDFETYHAFMQSYGWIGVRHLRTIYSAE